MGTTTLTATRDRDRPVSTLVLEGHVYTGLFSTRDHETKGRTVSLLVLHRPLSPLPSSLPEKTETSVSTLYHSHNFPFGEGGVTSLTRPRSLQVFVCPRPWGLSEYTDGRTGDPSPLPGPGSHTGTVPGNDEKGPKLFLVISKGIGLTVLSTGLSDLLNSGHNSSLTRVRPSEGLVRRRRSKNGTRS